MQRKSANDNNQISHERNQSQNGYSIDSSGASEIISDSTNASQNYNPILKKYQELLWKKIKNRHLRIAISKNREAPKVNQSVKDLSIEELIKRIDALHMQVYEKGVNQINRSCIHDRTETVKFFKKVVSDAEKNEKQTDILSEDRLTLSLLEEKQKLYAKLKNKHKKIMELKTELMESEIKLQTMTSERLDTMNEIESRRNNSAQVNNSRSEQEQAKAIGSAKSFESKIQDALKDASLVSHILYRLIAFSGVNWREDETWSSLFLSCGKPLSQQMEEVEHCDDEEP